MKKLIIASALMFALPALADHRSHPETRTADQLVDALDSLSDAARQQARNSYDRSAEREWRQIARQARFLSLDVYRSIYVPLRSSHSNFQRILRSYYSYKQDFQQLKNRVRGCGILPFGVTVSLNQADRLTTRLGTQLESCGGGHGPGPGHGSWTCKAVDSGWEEHWGGHTATGRTQNLAQRNAIRECERHHGRCVIRSCEVNRF